MSMQDQVFPNYVVKDAGVCPFIVFFTDAIHYGVCGGCFSLKIKRILTAAIQKQIAIFFN